MEALAITNKGIEDVCAREIEELINTHCILKEGFLIFDYEKEEELQFLCYNAQSIVKIIKIVENLNEFLKNKTFAVRAKNSKLISIVADKIKADVDLENPDYEIYALSEKYYGIDISKEDLSKRDYRIFLGPQSLKGNVAYALLRLADYSSSGILVDVFCKCGIIPIEAALYALNRSPHYYKKDKFDFSVKDNVKDKELSIFASDPSINHINAAKKNAKIAGINKKINFSRVELKNIDLKYKDVDFLVTMPSGNASEFFKQCKLIMKKNSRIVLIMKKGVEEYKKAFKFKLINERVIMQGKEKLNVLVYET